MSKSDHFFMENKRGEVKEGVWDVRRLEELKATYYHRENGILLEEHIIFDRGLENWFTYKYGEIVYCARKEPGKEKIIWINKLNGE